MGCAASNAAAGGSHPSQTMPSADAIRAIANSKPGGAAVRGGNRQGGHARTLDTNKPVSSRPTRVDELWALPQPTRNPDDIVLPPDEEPLPDIEPGDRGQHNSQLGIIAAGRYRMGFSTKDEDRVSVHADWLSTRRQEASRLLKEGKDLPRRMTDTERTLLLGSRRSVAGAGGESAAKPAPEALGSRVCFFAVLDGHGGDQVSNRLQRLLPAAAVRALSAPTPEDAKRAVALAEAAKEAAAAAAAGAADDAPAASARASLAVPGWAQPDDSSRQRQATLPGAPAGPEIVFRGAVHARSRPCVAAHAVRPRLNWLMRSIDEWVLSRRESMGDTAGTCLAAATIVGDALVVFNVGDCEAVLSVRGRPKELSRPHKASSEAEVKRIRKAGGNVHLRGSVFRVEGALAVSRSIGVAQLKIGRPASIIPDPHVRVVELTGEEEFLVMGSDGLFDKFPRKQDLVNTTKKYLRETRSATQSAEMLLNEAIDVRGSRDNASVVVIVFNQKGPPQHMRAARATSAALRGARAMSTGAVVPTPPIDAGAIRMGLPGAVGNTPLIRLNSLSEETGCEILGKAEFLNPGGSIKDRAALFLVKAAEESGKLKPGGTVVEGTAGNTGIGLAHVCNARGYKCVIYMPDTQSQEKISLLRVLGADVRPVPAVPFTDPMNYNHLAMEYADSHENAVWTNQFDNVNNRRAHEETTGPELWAQTGGKLDGFVCATGTGGTLAGISRALKAASGGSTKVYLADPPGSVLYSWVTSGGTKMERSGSSITEGIGQGRITDNLADTELDGAIHVPDERTVAMVFRLLAEEGLFLGASSCLNVVAAYDMAQRLGRGKVVSTVLCDGAARYQSRLFSRSWLEDKGLYEAVAPEHRHLVAFE